METIRIASIKPNDGTNGSGISVSLWVQGCPFHCDGCFNKETWDFNGGMEITIESLVEHLKNLIKKDGVIRNFSVLGGEPLAGHHRNKVLKICKEIRKAYPDIIICLWSGYTLDDKAVIEPFFDTVDYMILGQYEKDKHDIRLKWRGSSNQVIYETKGIE